LWFTHDEDVPVREGRRLTWIDKALAPASMTIPTSAARPLRRALVAVIGLEPVISLRDVGGLDDRTIEDTLVWIATSLVQAATIDR